MLAATAAGVRHPSRLARVLTDPSHLPITRPDAEAAEARDEPIAAAHASLRVSSGLLVVTASRLLFVALEEVVEDIPLRSISTLRSGGGEPSGWWLTVITEDEKQFVFQSLSACASTEVVCALLGALDRPDLRATFEAPRPPRQEKSEAKSS